MAPPTWTCKPLPSFVVIKPSSGSSKTVGDHIEVAVYWEFEVESSELNFTEYNVHSDLGVENPGLPLFIMSNCVYLGMYKLLFPTSFSLLCSCGQPSNRPPQNGL